MYFSLFEIVHNGVLDLFRLSNTLVVFFFFFLKIARAGLDPKLTRIQGKPEYWTPTQPKHPFNTPKTLQVRSGALGWPGLYSALPNMTCLLNGLIVSTHLSDFYQSENKKNTNFSSNPIDLDYKR